MASLCRACAQKQDVSLPPIRTSTTPCDFCGSASEDPKGRNYSYPSALLPGHKDEPNAVAEREERVEQ